jgi:hypothetical protein
VFENAGAGAAQLTITRPPQAVLYVSHNNQLLTRCQDGTAISTASVPYGVSPRPAGENLRDIVTGQTSFVNAYNGTATPYLSRLDTASGSQIWTHNTITELSTVSTASFGGIASFQNFVFMTDMNTTNATLAGIVRYNSTSNVFQRFSPNTDYIDVVLGLDDSLYALRGSGNSVDVYNPTTMNLGSTVTLAQTVRAIAVDATGRIFGASSTGNFFRFGANGAQQAQLASGVNSLTDLDLDENGLLVAGSTSGDVVETDVNLSAPFRFSVGNNTTFVAFQRESLGQMTATLSNSDPTELSVPASVDFLPGQTSVTVSVDAVDDNLLDGTQTVTIGVGALCYGTGVVSIDVLDHETLTVSITATSMAENAGPNAITGRLTRSNAGNDQTFTLVSSDTTEATVPATVTIPAGQPFVNFSINAVDDSLLDGTQTVTISATAPQYFVTSDTIQVTDFETLTVSIAANSVVETAGFAATTGTVTRGNSDISQALTLSITSSDTSELAHPGAVVIPAGQSSATFNIDAVDDNMLDGTQAVTLTPSAIGYVGIGDTLDVTDQENLSLTLGVNSVAENAGASATTVTVRRLNTDIGSPLNVVLMSSDTTEATVPLNIIIPSGLASLTVSISAVDDNLLDGTQPVTISAQAISYQTATANLSVTDHETVTVTVNPNSILESAGPNATTGTVTRSNTDNGSPLTVSLSSGDTTEATVPVSVIIPAGQASATFSINAVDDLIADGTQPATISATATGYAGVNGTVNVLDNETLTVNVVAVSVPENAGAGATTVSVTRNDGQTGTALNVTLSSSDTTEATVPATVTIPIGAASVTFNLDAVDDTVLDGPQTVTILASASGYVSGSDTVVVADAPQITDIGDQNINEDGATAALPFTLSDIAGDMTITATSSNPTLIPIANVFFQRLRIQSHGGGNGRRQSVRLDHDHRDGWQRPGKCQRHLHRQRGVGQRSTDDQRRG